MNIGGQTRSRIARLDPITGAADSFNPSALGPILSLAGQADGKILAGGLFSSIGGQPRSNIARLDAAAGLADSFNPNAKSFVIATAMQADGKILVSGAFSAIAGQTRFRFARLTNDTVAGQNLSVTPTAVTWTLSGATPQFSSVTFESSTDAVNYNLLGHATIAGSNWTLAGLNLATQENLYIRARARYGSSSSRGSESIQESVRNVFLTLPPTPNQVVSRKLHGGTPFDIVLPLAGNAGIECRSGGVNNDYEVVFTFPSAVTFANAAVTSGVGSVSSSSGSGTTTVTVNLTGVTNAQRIMVALQGASDGTNTGDLIVPMGILLGDTNTSASVSAADVAQTKAQSGQATSAANFRTDVNASGSISAADVALVKSKAGTSLPP